MTRKSCPVISNTQQISGTPGRSTYLARCQHWSKRPPRNKTQWHVQQEGSSVIIFQVHQIRQGHKLHDDGQDAKEDWGKLWTDDYIRRTSSVSSLLYSSEHMVVTCPAFLVSTNHTVQILNQQISCVVQIEPLATLYCEDHGTTNKTRQSWITVVQPSSSIYLWLSSHFVVSDLGINNQRRDFKEDCLISKQCYSWRYVYISATKSWPDCFWHKRVVVLIFTN